MVRAVSENTEDPADSNLKTDLAEAIEAEDGSRLTELVESVTSPDALREVSKLTPDDRDKLVTLIAPETAATLIEDAPADLALSLIEGLDSPVAAKIIEELPTNTQADIVNELDEAEAEAILSELDDRDAEQIRQLAGYDPDTAGGLMESEVPTLSLSDTVGGVLLRLAGGEEDLERYRGRNPYLLDATGRLCGVLSLRALLTSPRAATLSEVMLAPLSVTADTPLEALDALFLEHGFLTLPVVDVHGRPLGVVSAANVTQAMLRRAEHDSMSRQGVSDELRSMPTWTRSRRRLTWLSSNIVLNILAASVIAAYEETLAAVIAIAIFLPMVSDMSGCSGNQAIGVSMRELSLGLTRPADLFYVLKKELGVGVINGILLGLLIGIVAWVWKGNLFLGIVIGLALSVNTLISVSIGGTVPLALKRLGIDPAVASGPLLTTVTDIAGFFLVLSLATLFMPYLS